MTAERDLEKVKQKDSAAMLAHIDRSLFCDWQEGRLKGEEEAAFLGHVGACTFCAERFGDWMEEGFLLEIPEDSQPAPPKYLKEEILRRARQIDVQAARKLKETSRQMQLFLYSMKVGLAVALSIFLLALTTNLQDMDIEPARSQRAQQAQEWHRESQERREGAERDDGLVSSLRRGSREITGALNDLANGFFRVRIENESDQEVTR